MPYLHWHWPWSPWRQYNQLPRYKVTLPSFHPMVFGREQYRAVHTYQADSPPGWEADLASSELFCIVHLSVLQHLVICPTIDFYQFGLRNICFILWVISRNCYINSSAQYWSSGALSDGFLSLWHTPSIVGGYWNTSLFSDTVRSSMLILYIPAPVLVISPRNSGSFY